VRAYTERRSATGLMEVLRQRRAAGAEVACLECFPGGLAFALSRPLTVVDADGTPDELRSNWVLYRAARLGVLPARYIGLSALDAWLRESRPQGTCLVAGEAMLPMMTDHAQRLGWTIDSAADGWRVACSPATHEVG